MISFSCNCGQKIKVDDKYAGKTGKCPKCKAMIFVPEKELVIPVIENPYAKNRITNNDDLKLTEPTKSCPYCSETILETANKCKHCGEFLVAMGNNNSDKRRNKPISRYESTSYDSEILGVFLLIIPVISILLITFLSIIFSSITFLSNSLFLFISIGTVLSTAILALIEAAKLGIGKNPNGKRETGPIGWFFCFLLLWIIAYPAYLYKRGKYGLRNFCVFAIFIALIYSMAAFILPVRVVNEMGKRIECNTNLAGIGKAMMVYASDYNDIYPPVEKWCDLLIDKADISKESFICPDSNIKIGISNYAYNVNAADKKMSELPSDMVLVFEANENGWNKVGGRELISTKRHKGDGCNVLFCDLSTKFVKTSELSTLRWTAE